MMLKNGNEVATKFSIKSMIVKYLISYKYSLKISFFLLSIIIFFVIISNAEITKDKYGIISREKRSTTDTWIALLFAVYFVNIYINSKLY